MMKYVTDIQQQLEEYKEENGTRQNAKCHVTSILLAVVEYLFYYTTNSEPCVGYKKADSHLKEA